MLLTDFLDKLQGVKQAGGNHTAKCPAHEDRQNSLSVTEKDGKILIKCFAGCETKDIVEALGVTFKDLHTGPDARSNGKTNGGRAKKTIKATYDYRDAEGALLYQVVRYEPKSFKQRRPDPQDRDKWIWNLQGVERVLYRLSDVLTSIASKPTSAVFVVEGEKDADNLARLGFTATTNAGGAAKWSKSYNDVLSKAHAVFVIPDNDPPGRLHAQRVAKALPNACVIELPGLPPKGDVSDWISAGGTAAQLRQMSSEAWDHRDEPRTKAEQAESGEHVEPLVPLSNYSVEMDADGKKTTVRINAPQISHEMFRQTDKWPRRVDRVLFADEKGSIRWLEHQHDLFGWLDERFHVFWRSGDKLTKAEYFSHVLAHTEAYEAVETLPHEPQLPNTYYNWKPPAGYKADGSHLDQLVRFFRNTKTKEDSDLIKALFVTPAWGGPLGTRPAGIIQADDRGHGKTTLAEAIGELYGGVISVDPGERGEDRLVSRLLTLSARTRRVVLVDNMKSAKSSALVEGLITGRAISGHMLHVGNAERPNTLMWLFTGNTVQLSRDLADRAFIVHLAKPTPAKGWRDAVFRFIQEHRDKILADAVALLRGKPQCGTLRDRWQSWADGVLAHVTPQAAALVDMNQERRDSVDVELDEAGEIAAAVERYKKDLPAKIRAKHPNCNENQVFAICSEEEKFISSTDMTKLLNDALGIRLSTKKIVNVVKGHIEAGRLPGFSHRHDRMARGFDVP